MTACQKQIQMSHAKDGVLLRTQLVNVYILRVNNASTSFFSIFNTINSYLPHILLNITSFLLPIWSTFDYEASVLSLLYYKQGSMMIMRLSGKFKVHHCNRIFIPTLHCIGIFLLSTASRCGQRYAVYPLELEVLQLRRKSLLGPSPCSNRQLPL